MRRRIVVRRTRRRTDSVRYCRPPLVGGTVIGTSSRSAASVTVPTTARTGNLQRTSGGAPAQPRRGGSSFLYVFSDYWRHKVVVDKVFPAERGARWPACIGGRRACPPGDCSGPWGYVDFLEAIKDPDDEEHDSMLEWVGRPVRSGGGRPHHVSWSAMLHLSGRGLSVSIPGFPDSFGLGTCLTSAEAPNARCVIPPASVAGL